MRRYAEWVHEMARSNFLTAGSHVELFFLLTNEGKGELVPVTPGVDRESLSGALRRHLSDGNHCGVVHVAEGWCHLPLGPDDEEWNRVARGETHVSTLGHRDKEEALIVTMDCKVGTPCFWMAPIFRKSGEVALGDSLLSCHPLSGRFARFFDRES